MWKYLRESFRRKKARRFTREYPSRIVTFDLEEEGQVEFAQWDNPLVLPSEISKDGVGFFKALIKEGDFAIDIGAHIGDTTVPMALAAGPSGLVLGFDPNPRVFRVLQENASLNRDKTHIIPHCLAISTEEEEFFFISSEASFANGGISPTRKSHHGKYVLPEKIKGVNLQRFLEANYADRVDGLALIKIDAEGYDKEIIKAISGLIANARPIVIAECFKNSTDDEKVELFEVLANQGYALNCFEEFSARGAMTRLTSGGDLLKWKTTVNILARPLS